MYGKRRKSWGKHLDFILIDLFSIVLAFVVGYSIRHGWNLHFFMPTYYRSLLLALLVTNLSVSFIMESHKSIVRRGYFAEFKEVIMHCLVVDFMILIALFFMQISAVYSRETFIIFGVLQIFVTYCLRCIRKHRIRLYMMKNPNVEQMLILADEEHIKQCVKELSQDVFRNYQIVGVVLYDENEKEVSEKYNEKVVRIDTWAQEAAASMESVEEIAHVPVVCTMESLNDYLLAHVVDSVFIDSNITEEMYQTLTQKLVQSGVTVHINLMRLPHELPNRSIEQIGNYTVLTMGMRIVTLRQIFLKRVMDIVGGICGAVLTILATIIFGPIIFIQSPGPIFFKQTRMGKNGRKFRIYKLRSMYNNAEKKQDELMKQNKMEGLMFKLDNDPRVIPIGRFIRKYSIDELPQFFNVLKGDMSLVGTRPPTAEEFKEYDLHHRGRLSSKPGITGLWQISGRSDITDFEEVVLLDTEYIINWSLSEDIRILRKTVKLVLGGNGAV